MYSSINQHPTAIMNIGIIPVLDDVLKYRSLLFDLTTPITLLAEEFDKVWPFVSSVYSAKLDAVPERIAAGKLAPIYEHDTLTCHCRFARRYLLPCRDVFHLDSEVKVLTPEK
jgi:hypothetical protein